ncbi:trehalose-phosphatase [Halalkalicoccus subterraneus]|uniref:trehalose-phosphatase n=1 Tax=Halalkalicoccus subterraneus TaxID=2675002 RepID=UPI000EFAE163|nr:trehalose-phosphatase [Halalkalicoccus subterraneus]
MPEQVPDSTRPFGVAREEIRRRVESAEGLLFCTDFDGTLAPIEPEPDDAEITPENKTLLRRIREAENTRVAVISGRALADVSERVGLEGLTYAGNHGLELRRGERSVVHPIAAKHRERIERICTILESRLSGIEGTHIENKTVTATVHYRNAPDDAIRDVRDIVRSVVSGAGDGRLRRTDGKEIVEIRPEVRWNKGMVISLLAEDYPNWLPVYVGDDTTDESAFRSVAEGLSVYVGEDRSNATYRIPAQAEVSSRLTSIAEWYTTD